MMSRSAQSIHYPHGKNSGYYEAFDEVFMEKKLRMDIKYQTAATKLWITTACEELNEKLIEVNKW
ncbi:MAG TPA: hypothetical protein VF941_01110, partial [Clostridia bacterium]